LSVRVYEYGLLPPTVNAELVEQQLQLAHRYRNMLTEIERDRRTQVREIMSSHQDMAPLQERINELTAQRDAKRDAIKKQRSATRSRSESKADRDAIKELNEQIKQVVLQIKSIRASVAKDPAVQLGLKEADAVARQRVRDERARCGVYWGTYLLQEADADRARQESSMPKFEPYRGNGRLSVQLQGGLELADLWGSSTQLQISPVSRDANDPNVPRGMRRRASRTVVRMRISSVKSRPVWAEWPMVMHRPLPEGAVIKVATILRRKRDCVSWYWRLQLTVDTTACIDARSEAPARGALALNLGFCVRPGGTIRSGYLLGSDGHSQEVLVVKSDLYRGKKMSPEEAARAETWITNGLKKADDIRSIRDNNLNIMKAAFAPWCARMAELRDQPASRDRTTQDQPDDRDAFGDTGHTGELDRPGGRSRDMHLTPEQPGLPGTEEPQNLERPVGLTGQENRVPQSVGYLEQPGDSGTNIGSIAHPQEQPGSPGHQVREFPKHPGAWFFEAASHVGMWLSAARFRALSLRWESERFAGDEEGFTLLREWRDRDEHLERYEAGIRGSALRDRLEAYRNIAAQMAKRYRTLIIDGTDLSKYQDAGPVEGDKRDSDVVRRNQRIAAGSLLRGALMNAFGPDRTSKMPPGKRTTTCHRCGKLNDWDRAAASTRLHTCSGCGVQWDVDANFCRNLLADWATTQLEPPTAIEEPKKPSRSQRLRQAATVKFKAESSRA
jgi:hypothetical protein